jgi:hypothetical protein
MESHAFSAMSIRCEHCMCSLFLIALQHRGSTVVQRTAIFLLLVLAASRAPAQATPVQFDFTIDFLPSVLTDPAFADGAFRGTASFFLDRGDQGLSLISGEEIFIDKYSRVKIKFNWDRPGSSNPCDGPGCAFQYSVHGSASGFPAFAFADTGATEHATRPADSPDWRVRLRRTHSPRRRFGCGV